MSEQVAGGRVLIEDRGRGLGLIQGGGGRTWCRENIVCAEGRRGAKNLGGGGAEIPTALSTFSSVAKGGF